MTDLQRAVHDALSASGDPTGAMLWRQKAAQLSGPIRVAVTAWHPTRGPHWFAALPSIEGLTWVWVEPPEDLAWDLGAQDRLLGTHAMLVLTPATNALTRTERDALSQLDAIGAPSSRAVVLVDEDLIRKLSDDADSEIQTIRTRVDNLTPAGWTHPGHASAFASALQQQDALLGDRLEALGRFLIGERVTALRAALDSHTARQSALDEREAAARRAAAERDRSRRRLAAHTLAIYRRQTDALRVDLAAELQRLEAELPVQVGSVEDLAIARRALPHWLSQGVETWITDRIARWADDVRRELSELDLDPDIHAEAVAPALHPPSPRTETRWASRLATTAAFGGAAALLTMGLWIPGLIAAAGGLVWSNAQRGPGDEETRRTLVQQGREAIRQMGTEAERLLGDQLDALADEARRLQTDTADGGLDADLADIQRRRDQLAIEADALKTCISTLVAVHGAS